MQMLDHDKLYKSVSQKDKEAIVDKAYRKIIKNFYTQDKIEITHDYDPPFDCSGQAYRTHEYYRLMDYQTFEDFLEEYNGASQASYMSGCGLFWRTYSDEIEDEIRDENYDYCKTILTNELNLPNIKWEEVKKKDSSYSIHDYYDEFDNELYDDFILPIEYNLMDMKEVIAKEPFVKALLKYSEAEDLEKIKHLFPANNQEFTKSEK